MKGFAPSLLDKLFDDESRLTAVAPVKRLSMEELKESVARDLEGLLNSRFAMSDEALKAYPNCQRSLFTYGLNDFSGMSLASSNDRTQICRSLELAIARHEPRLKNVTVLLEGGQKASPALRFAINAMLVVHPEREPISFDALLQSSIQQYSVSKSRRSAGAM